MRFLGPLKGVQAMNTPLVFAFRFLKLRLSIQESTWQWTPPLQLSTQSLPSVKADPTRGNPNLVGPAFSLVISRVKPLKN